MVKIMKSLMKIGAIGSRLVWRSVRKAVLDEIQQSQERAKQLKQAQGVQKKRTNTVDVEEAKLILNVDSLDQQAINKRFDILF